MIQVNSKLRECSTGGSVLEMFKYPTVRSLAEYLSSQEDTKPNLR